jgi:hypothetical protein
MDRKPNELRTFLDTKFAAFSDRVDAFVLRNGRSFSFNDRSFEGPAMKVGQCYQNAALLVVRDPRLTYVEGYVAVGIPIAHAWTVLPDGSVIDPTLRGDTTRITEYFGVEFDTRYLHHCLWENGVYGLLDQYHSRKTIGALLDGTANFKPTKKEPTPCQ